MIANTVPSLSAMITNTDLYFVHSSCEGLNTVRGYVGMEEEGYYYRESEGVGDNVETKKWWRYRGTAQ